MTAFFQCTLYWRGDRNLAAVATVAVKLKKIKRKQQG
jgi:hypothetical protein